MGQTGNINNIFKNIKHIYHNKKITIYLSGGEPTLHPKFLYLLENLLQLIQVESIVLSTNFSKPISYWNDVLSLTKKYSKKLEVHCSLHIMEHHTQKDFEMFFEKYFYLKNNSIHMYIMTVLDDKSYPILKHAIINYLPQLNVTNDDIHPRKNIKILTQDILNNYMNDIKETMNLYLQNVNNKNNDIDDGTFYHQNNTQNNFFKSSIIRNVSISLECFKNAYCYAGIKWLYINVAGNVYSTYSLCKTYHKYLGNILNQDYIQIPKQPIICQDNHCEDMCNFKLIPKSNFIYKEWLD